MGGITLSGGQVGWNVPGSRVNPREACESEWRDGSRQPPALAQESPKAARDRMLVLRCLEGEEAAWDSLVRSYSRLILNFCFRFTGQRDLAEDLTQEIFLRAYRNLNSFRSESAGFRTWLYRLSRNLLIDYHRREKRHWRCFGGDTLENLSIRDDRALEPQRVLEQEEAARFLNQGLMSLPTELREAITLRELEGMSYKEIADATGAPEGTIKSRVSRGRLQLEKLLSRRRRRSASHYSFAVRKSPLQLSYA